MPARFLHALTTRDANDDLRPRRAVREPASP
jgi:hypothetical protein